MILFSTPGTYTMTRAAWNVGITGRDTCIAFFGPEWVGHSRNSGCWSLGVGRPVLPEITELCVLRTFGGVDFSLVFICAQYVPEFLWDRLHESIQFPVMPKRAQYARFCGEYGSVSRLRAFQWYTVRDLKAKSREVVCGIRFSCRLDCLETDP